MIHLKIIEQFRVKANLLIVFLLISPFSFAQQYADPEFYLVDSLNFDDLMEEDKALLDEQLALYHETSEDTVKVNILEVLIEKLRTEVWIKYNKAAYDLCQKKLRSQSVSDEESLFYRSHLAGTINNMGFATNAEGNAFLAVDYYMQASKIFESIQDSFGMALTYINAATAYQGAGELELSNQMDMKGLEIGHDINHMKILSVGYKNISMKLFNAEHYDEALENSLASLKYAQLIPEDPVAEAVSLMGIGQIYAAMGKDSLASLNFNSALRIKKDHATEASYASSLEVYCEFLRKSLFKIPQESERFRIIKDSTEKSLLFVAEECRRLHQTTTLIRTLRELSSFYYTFSDLSKSLKYIDEAYEIVNSVSNLTKTVSVTRQRYRVLKRLGKYKEALEMLEESNEASDKLNYNDAVEVAARQKVKLEYTVKATKDSVKYAAAQEIQQQELAHKEEQIASSNRMKWILIVGISLIAVFSFFLFKKFKQTESQNKLIHHQKEQIVEAHDEVRASIEYAKRLQAAILAPLEEIQNSFTSSFILFKPKDIVSGDFYWYEEYQGLQYIAAADCTGHGVPGAMVSVVCSKALHQAVHEFGKTDPAEILDKTRDLVIETFAKSGESVKDGMDISLCQVDLKSKQVVYAGANNPLWIKRAGSDEMEVVKADKQPVGLFEGMTPFTSHTISIQEGDQLYMFTDGFADQFGGDKGKKMKYKPFKQVLLQTSVLSAEEQHQSLLSHFDQWKSTYEQIDDVCIVGLRI